MVSFATELIVIPLFFTRPVRGLGGTQLPDGRKVTRDNTYSAQLGK